MPLIKGFESTTILKAFLLNSLASTLIILLAITIKKYYDQLIQQKFNKFTMIIKTLVFTFLTTFISYYSLYFLFGYGKGMLIPP